MTRNIIAALSLGLLALTPAYGQKAADPPAPACADDPLYRQLDFTAGTWDVFGPNGKNAEVTMAPALNGCAIQESWKKPGGGNGNGLGLFTYSRILKGWTYAWASDTGAATSFVGGLVKPGEMLFKTQRPGPSGGVRTRHWSLIAMPDGSVRELSLATDDEGKTWITEYDLKWVRKQAQ